MAEGGFLRVLDDLDNKAMLEKEKAVEQNKSVEQYKPVDKRDNLESNEQEERQENADDTVYNEFPLEAEESREALSAEHEKESKTKWNKAKLLKEKNRELERRNAEMSQKMGEMDEQLKQVYNSNIYNYSSSVNANLDMAKKDYTDTLTYGSPEEIATATANYTLALNEFQNAKRVMEDHQAINEQYKNERDRVPQYREEQQVDNSYHQNEWLRENPELDSKSRYYDPKLERKIMVEADKLNDHLISQRAEHLIGTPEYLDKLEEFVEYYKNSSSNSLKGYGVTNRNATSNNINNELGEKEARAAAAFNMTPQEYKKMQASMPSSLRYKQQSLRGGR